MKIIIPGKPIAWQRAGTCGRRFFDRQAKERKVFQQHLRNKHQRAPSDAPINLTCVFSFKLPDSASKTKRTALLGMFRGGRPDTDNLLKWIGDASQGILWNDDSQIVQISGTKIWDAVASTTISFEELPIL